MSKLNYELQGDTQIVLTRQFAASPERIYQAHIDPDLIPRWMTGPDGWTMVDCQSDARPGGAIRFEWKNDADGSGFHLTGEYKVLEPSTRIDHVERMHLPDPTPDNNISTRFEAKDGGTLLTMTMSVPDKETREMMLATGMTNGMEISYARLETIL